MAGTAGRNYRDYVNYYQQINPGVGGLATFLAKKRLPQDSSQLYTIEFSTEGKLDHDSQVKKRKPGELPALLTSREPGRALILIVEDLHPSVLEILGATLDIDPIFFADYVSTTLDDVENSPASPAITQTPSQILSQRHWFHIHYQQIVDLSSGGPLQLSPWVLKTSGNVPRSVRRLPFLQRKQLGIVRGCCSVLTKRLDQSWLGLILVDSSASDIISDPVSNSDAWIRLRRVPLHHAFGDAQIPLSFSSFRSHGPWHDVNSRKGSLMNHTIASLLQTPPVLGQAGLSPLNLAYHPLQAILSTWMIYSQVVARFLKHYEFSLNIATPRIQEDDMIDLQKWRHRLIQTQFKLASTKDYILYHYTSEPGSVAWDLMLKDLDSLSLRIVRYGQSLERVIPVATSMSLLFHYQLSTTEAMSIKRLSYVALVFVPLSWVGTVFSMTNDFAPGQPKFWIYFAVSVPFCVMTVALSLLISSLGGRVLSHFRYAHGFLGGKTRKD